MLKSFLAVAAGTVSAASIVFVGEGIGHMLFPPPAGIDVSKPGEMATLFSKLPPGAILSVLIAWAVAAFFGGGVAALISRRFWPGITVGFIMLAFAGWTMIEIPHPLWFMLASIPAAVLPAALAGRWFGKPAAV